MKRFMLILFAAGMLLLMGCKNSVSNPEEPVLTEDDRLIQAIQLASNKQVIEIAQLPAESRDILTQTYSDGFAELIQAASGLGYEVNLRVGTGIYVGERSQHYFNLRGRELISSLKGGKGWCGNKCFDFVYPITFIMPDGSTVIVENKNGYAAVKDWYMANPDARQRPALQYPVNIIFKDGMNQTINNDAELRRAYERCLGK